MHRNRVLFLSKYLLSFVFIFSAVFIKAQELKVEAEVGNLSNIINNGYVELTVSGGTPPYSYKWSDQNTYLHSPRAEGLTEGIPYTVTITDNNGITTTRLYTVKAKAVTEIFNGAFVPLVDKMASFLFWDPFTAIGLYDPKVYSENKNVPIPNWHANVNDRFILKNWIVAEGKSVNEGELIALVESYKDGEIEVFANAKGKLHHLTQEGDIIFDSQNQDHVIEMGAHHLAEIEYEEPIVLTHPNGDPLTYNIPFIVIWLIVGAVFFTIRMGFINFRGVKHSIELARGKYDDPDAPGKITHFQTLSTAVSATVGLGNIAGVAVAISLGGAGATFWMILAGIFGMALKFVECSLGVKYRTILADGRIFGGPMSYLRKGLEKRNMKGLGKVLAVVFSFLCIGAAMGAGNMIQSNQSYEILAGQFEFLEGNGFWFGLVFAILVGIVILGGIESIGKVTSKIVPFMAGLYVFAAFVVIGINIDNLSAAFSAIYNGAFNASALKGGFIGVMIVGFQRAAFSSEMGVGSAAIAHSAGKTRYSSSEGHVALLEPFIDTVVVCTLTALVLIFSGMHEVSGVGGVQLTADAFATVISWFPYLLSVIVLLFAFSTTLSWSYYGMRAWTFLFGKSRRSEFIYKILYLCFVVLGASAGLGAVLSFADMMLLAMAFPNIIGLYILSGEVSVDLKKYTRKLKAGELFIKSEGDNGTKAA